MKKIISLLIATMMAVSMMAISALPAMAATVNSPTAATLQEGKAQTTVNGETKQGVTYTVNKTKTSEVSFSYNGEGTFKSWSDNLSSLGLAEGTDYTKTVNADNTITLTFVSQKAITAWNDGKVIVNAVVEFATTTEATTKEDTTDAEETTKKAAKKNNSSKSPATGVSTSAMAGIIATVGAGFAVMAATKKKDND